MRWDIDCQAEAERAMRQALDATTAIDRANWVRAALAWQDLARDLIVEPASPFSQPQKLDRLRFRPPSLETKDAANRQCSPAEQVAN
jgi:hypothetical protein